MVRLRDSKLHSHLNITSCLFIVFLWIYHFVCKTKQPNSGECSSKHQNVQYVIRSFLNILDFGSFFVEVFFWPVVVENKGHVLLTVPKLEFLGITQRFLQNPVNLDMVDGCEKDLQTRQVGDTNRQGAEKKKTANPQVVVFLGGKMGIMHIFTYHLALSLLVFDFRSKKKTASPLSNPLQ